jgi:adenine-specific DNA-methyltransferase
LPVLDFKGKQFVYTHHLSVPFRELIVDEAKSCASGHAQSGLDGNLIIHGDNLHALKALLPTHAGRVKCIYIDPPYNTGTEGWCYNDNVRSPLMQEWLKKSANPVDKEDLERHDKWLCMMWPRLQLLKELLADDGAIFISIDDNELDNLLVMATEVFDGHHVATIPVVNNMKGRNDKDNIARCHEYLVVFDKGRFVSRGLPLTERQKKEFKYIDEAGYRFALRDLRKRGGADTREERENLFYPMYYNTLAKQVSAAPASESGIEIYPIKQDGSDGCWRWSREKAAGQAQTMEARYVPRNGKWNVFYRVYLDRPDVIDSDVEDDIVDEDDYSEELEQYVERTTKPKSFWWGPELSTDTAGKLLKKILGVGGESFDHPKSPYFLSRIIHMAAGPEDIVLDSFAGSGTTAHAVLALNKELGENRRFILVECESYASTITAERVRRVIAGVPTARDRFLKSGFGGSFAFCELGDEINIEALLRDGKLPSYESLAKYVYYTATGKTLNGRVKLRADYFIGDADGRRIYLVYRPDREFLRSADSALSEQLLTQIGPSGPNGKHALVFATAKYMSQKSLSERGIEFCQLPYAIHRVIGN